MPLCRVNFYLYCDDKTDDEPFQQSDEVYLAVGFRTGSGNHYQTVVGPNDYRDGGDRERWRDYNSVLTTELDEGDFLAGFIIVMEAEAGIFSFITALVAKLGTALLAVPIPSFQVVGAVAAGAGTIANELSAKGDKRLGMFHVNITNVKGQLQVSVRPDGDDIRSEGTGNRPSTEGRDVLLHNFRLKGYGGNYHAAVWEGAPQGGPRPDGGA